MTEDPVELYGAGSDRAGAVRRCDRARLAAEQLAREGVPDDETCFYLYEAASLDIVREAARRAGFTPDRLPEAVSDTKREMT